MPQQRLSSRLIRKGSLIEETYRVFQQWDLDRSIVENLHAIEVTNAIGANNQAWLQEITRTLSNRFKGTNYQPLVVLAQGGYDIGKWKACLLWHIGTYDALYWRYATEWLYPQYVKGTVLLRTDDVVPFVQEITSGVFAGGKGFTEYGRVRAARDLLRMSTDFGLLTGSIPKQFASYHLHEECLLYVAHAISERESNARRLVDALDWRLYLMSVDDVEREFFNLHQYRRLEYHVAGSLAQLKLPHNTMMEYARSLVS